MDIGEAIQNRRSVKKFSKEKPNWRRIIEAVDAARYAPMAGNLFSLRFILVGDKNRIKKLAEACQQEFISDASYVVVVCSDSSLISNAYPEKSEIYLRQQAGAAIQNFLLKLSELGLSTCWIGYFADNQIKNLLGIPENVVVEAIFPIGYEKKLPGEKSKKKINIDSILFFERYKNKKMQDKKRLFE